MSQALSYPPDDPGETAPPPDTDAAGLSVEQRARLNGWKPQAEYRGDKEWRSAEDFLKEGEDDWVLNRKRLQILEARHDKALKRIENINQQNEELHGVLNDMTERFRRAEDAGYKRARREMESKRDDAVRSGDETAFKAIDQQMQELDRDHAQQPTPAQRQAPKEQPANQTPPRPEAVEWAARNPWFHNYPDLQKDAVDLHLKLQERYPDMPLAENLERVTRTMAGIDDRVRTTQARRPPEDVDPEPDNRRRPSPVSGSREAPRRGVAPRSFAALPQDAKDAYGRFKRAIESKPMGKGKPLTEEEFAANYAWDD